MIALLLLAAAQDEYQIRFQIKADNHAQEAKIIKSSLADTDGIVTMDFDGGTEVLTLKMRGDSLVTASDVKAAIARLYPRSATVYMIERTEIIGLVGDATKPTLLKVEPMHTDFTLEPADALDEKIENGATTFRLTGLLEEGKGRFGRPTYTLNVTRVETVKRSESKKAERFTVRVLIEGAEAADEGDIEKALNAVAGVGSCEFDADAGTATCEVETKSKVRAADFLKAVKRGRATSVRVDGLDGTVRQEEGEVRFTASNGQEFDLVPDGKLAEAQFKRLDKILKGKDEIALAGEFVDGKSRGQIRVRLLRAAPADD